MNRQLLPSIGVLIVDELSFSKSYVCDYYIYSQIICLGMVKLNYTNARSSYVAGWLALLSLGIYVVSSNPDLGMDVRSVSESKFKHKS